MNRPVILFAAFFLLSMSAAHAGRLLIDDFSIDQQGIETGQNAAFDLLEDPRLFGGGREIVGGGDTIQGNCETTTITAEVSDGAFRINGGADCAGAAFVRWPNSSSETTVDLSGYTQIEIEVAEFVSDVPTRVSIVSETTGPTRFDVTLNDFGVHTFKLPEEIDLSAVQQIAISSFVKPSEFVAVSKVSFAVPEPSTVLLLGAYIPLPYVARRVRKGVRLLQPHGGRECSAHYRL